MFVADAGNRMIKGKIVDRRLPIDSIRRIHSVLGHVPYRLYILATNSSKACSSVTSPSSFRFFQWQLPKRFLPLRFVYTCLSLYDIYPSLTSLNSLLKHRIQLSVTHLISFELFFSSILQSRLFSLIWCFTNQSILLIGNIFYSRLENDNLRD